MCYAWICYSQDQLVWIAYKGACIIKQTHHALSWDYALLGVSNAAIWLVSHVYALSGGVVLWLLNTYNVNFLLKHFTNHLLLCSLYFQIINDQSISAKQAIYLVCCRHCDNIISVSGRSHLAISWGELSLVRDLLLPACLQKMFSCLFSKGPLNFIGSSALISE